ncbi:uncharacterized protein LOC104428941 [Eucalyptus grandis]|uniref:uncharacterized protein LOC104428941 n=1 Tax=Eucalyptus grandis TaxID=71139 RepID=UPI00052482C0|nr:uncharacterized protein LOC104428941 [Eucalyptus grandis]
MDNRTQEKVVSKGRSRDPRRAADAYSESALEKIIVLFRLGYAALSLGRPRKQDPRTAAKIYSDCALDSIIVLLKLGNEALLVGCPREQACLGRVEDPATSPSCAVRQSKGKQRTELRELSEQNSELSKKLRAATKRPVQLQREVQKSPIKGWWEASMDQLSLEELKLHKRMSEELSKMLTQEIEDRTTNSHGNNSDDPCGTDS